MQNGDKEMIAVVSQLKIIAKSNQDLAAKLDKMESNDKSETEFENLRKQNAQL